MMKVKLIECLRKIAKENGFTLAEFVKYKSFLADEKCYDGYKSVYPEDPIMSTSGDKEYVDNLQIMLSDNLYKSGVLIKLQPKILKEYSINNPPNGWYVSEKWDGIRAIWDGEKFVSRGSGVGKPKVYTYVPEWFKRCMPPGIAMDGEMWIGRGLFQKISGVSNYVPGGKYSRKQLDLLWAGKLDTPQILFKAFDIPGVDIPFQQRMSRLKMIIEDRKKCWDKSKKEVDFFPIQFTDQVLVNNNVELQAIFGELVANGAEGIILRAPNSMYQAGKRSKLSLKYKIKEDAECIVKGYIPGEGRLDGLLGSLKCELILNGKLSGVTSHIGTGFTDIQRTDYNNPKSKDYIPIGSVVSFSFMERTKDGIPRHPVYRGVRHDFKVPSKDQPHEQQDKEKVVEFLKKLILKIQTDRELNWAFKRKRFQNVIDILVTSNIEPNNINDYITILRGGGMKLEAEEKTFEATGQWKSSTLEKIDEILTTGTLSEIKEDPKITAVEELIKIPGVGETAASKLYSMGIETIPGLIVRYTNDKSILNDKQAIGLLHYDDLQKRIPRSEMDSWKELFNKIKPGNSTIEMVGSYRRLKETSGDVDVLLRSDDPKSMNMFTKSFGETIENVISSGPTKLMAIAKINETYRHIDVFYYPPDVYPFALLFLTGSGPFNQQMRAFASKQGYSLSDKGFRHTSPNGPVVTSEEIFVKLGKSIQNEKDIFEFLGIDFVPPEKRDKLNFTKKNESQE
jgi:DNA ligase 1